MSGRKPLLENDEPLVIFALKEFSLRNQALVLLGLNTGFRITEILSLTVGQVWDAGHVKPQVKVSRAQLKGRRGYVLDRLCVQPGRCDDRFSPCWWFWCALHDFMTANVK